jgi:hypothetical protein
MEFLVLAPHGVLLVLIFLFVASHLAWWFGRRYFPSVSLCAWARAGLPGWLRRAGALLTEMPQGVGAKEFLALLAWPCVVFLNLIFLAKILEVVMPGGRQIALPYFGAYRFPALVIGVLFALVQSWFGIFMAEAASKKARLGYGCLLFFTILTEVGLGLYRARLIMGGAAPISGSLVDQAIAESGLIFTGAMGALVPAAHTALGFYAWRFLEQMIHYAMRVAGAAILFVWSAVTWLLFGWHPLDPPNGGGITVILPAWATEVDRKQRRVQEATPKLRDRLQALAEANSRILEGLREFDGLTSFHDAELEGHDLAAQAEQCKQSWRRNRESWNARLLEATKLPDVDRLDDELREAFSSADRGSKEVINGVGRLESKLDKFRSLPERVGAFRAEAAKCNKMLTEALAQIGRLRELAGDLSAWVKDVREIANGRPRTAEVVPKPQCEQIQQLVRSASGAASNTRERATWDACVTVLNQAEHACGEAGGVLEAAEQAVRELQRHIEGFHPPSPPEAGDLDAMERSLAALEDAIVDACKDEHRALAGSEKKAFRKRWVLEGRPRWLWILRHLFTGPYDPAVGLFPQKEKASAPPDDDDQPSPAAGVRAVFPARDQPSHRRRARAAKA